MGIKHSVDGKTVKELLEIIAVGEHFEGDERFMTNFMRKVGYSNVVVTCGIVYAEGRGTLEYPPTGMETFATAFLKAV